MINYEEIKSHIRDAEGYSATPYKLTYTFTKGSGLEVEVQEDFWTVGHGLNIGKEKRKFTASELEDMFEDAFEKCVKGCNEILDGSEQPQAVHFVLISMIYNMGLSGTKLFKNMIQCIKDGRYPDASNELKDSKYYNQLRSRVQHYVDMLEVCR